MQLTITLLDEASPELEAQLPLVVELLKKLPGPDRPDYWIGALMSPLRWKDGGEARECTHVALCTRVRGESIEMGMRSRALEIYAVTDRSLLFDGLCEPGKRRYAAIGFADETSRGRAF